MINHISTASAQALKNETLDGKYGNGDVRKTVLGSRYDEVQNLINAGSFDMTGGYESCSRNATDRDIATRL